MQSNIKFYTTMAKNNDILYYISTENYDEVIKLITEANVNNIIDEKNKYTSLHYAIRLNNVKIMEYLLNMGANPYLKTSSKEDAFDLSLKYQTKFVITYQLDEEKENNKELKKIISTLEKKINNLDINNKYLLKSIDDLMIKNDNFKKENSMLKTKNSSLTKEVNGLFSSKLSLEKKYEDSNKEISLLREQINFFKYEYDDSNKNFNILKRKFDVLTDEHKILDNAYSNLLNTRKR